MIIVLYIAAAVIMAVGSLYFAWRNRDFRKFLLTRLYEGQNATVLTLPMQPKTAAEAEAQQRVAYVG